MAISSYHRQAAEFAKMLRSGTSAQEIMRHFNIKYPTLKEWWTLDTNRDIKNAVTLPKLELQDDVIKVTSAGQLMLNKSVAQRLGLKLVPGESFQISKSNDGNGIVIMLKKIDEHSYEVGEASLDNLVETVESETEAA